MNASKQPLNIFKPSMNASKQPINAPEVRLEVKEVVSWALLPSPRGQDLRFNSEAAEGVLFPLVAKEVLFVTLRLDVDLHGWVGLGGGEGRGVGRKGGEERAEREERAP